ncbi:MAG: flagellar hook-length control protein FliK [Brevinematia bacterium]
MLELINKNNSISDIKSDNIVEKTKVRFNENENGISFKETLEKIEKDIKANKQETSKITEKIDKIEKKLEAIKENKDLSIEDQITIKNFLKDLKLLLDLIKEANVKSESGKIFDDLSNFENLIFSIEQLLALTLNLIEKADFKSLKELIKSTSPILSAIRENIHFPLEKNTEDVSKLINKIEDKKNIELSKTTEKPVVKFENVRIERDKNIENLLSTNEKYLNVNKKEVDFLKEFILVNDKRVEKPIENAVVKNYNVFTSSLNRVNIESLIAQITGKAVIIVREGKSELKMQLFPPDLGKMNMKFTLEDGQLTGKIVVSTKEAFMLFDQNKESLAQSLNQAGVNIGRIDISLGEFDTSGEQNFEGMEEKSFTFGRVKNLNEVSEETEHYTGSLYDGIINYLV